MPTTMLGLQNGIKNYSVLLDVLLGINHCVSQDFCRFVHIDQVVAAELRSRCEVEQLKVPAIALLPALVLWWVDESSLSGVMDKFEI